MFAPQNFNQDGREYLTHANDNVMVIVQIESRLAVENCEAIARTPGVGKFVAPQRIHLQIQGHSLMGCGIADMLFVGPNDLAASMGYFAFDHPNIEEVQQATVRVLKAAKDAGKFAGHFALNAETGQCSGLNNS